MKGIIFVFLCLNIIQIVAGQTTYCDPCQKMLIELRERFNNNFKNVRVQQIIDVMTNECSIEMAGTSGMVCRSKVKENACKLLRYLRLNATNDQACTALGLC